MPDNGTNIISSLQKKWQAQSFVFWLLIAMSLAFFVAAFLEFFFHAAFWWIFFLASLFIAVMLFPKKRWQIDEHEVASFLNQTFPELEESAALLHTAAQQQGLLQYLQKKKVESIAQQLILPRPLNKRLAFAACTLVASLFLFFTLRSRHFQTSKSETPIINNSQASTTEKLPAQIKQVSIKIIPPAYTRIKTSEQSDLDIKTEEGANISWNITASEALQNCEIILNDSSVLELHPDETKTSWSFSKSFSLSSFYQLKINDKILDLHKIEMVKDEPPVINIQSPKSYTTIDFGEPQRALLRVSLKDDYGIKSGKIMATVASGSGEAVQFKQAQVAFDNSFVENKSEYDLSKMLNLSSFNMKPGDELYFYVQAEDTKSQESRSDMYIISLPDTAQLMSLDGLTMGLDIKPEYFRSERQIIIETEQLLKEKDTISEQAFKDRSNNLGIDQKILRLRYGKFLGEEGEENIGNGKNEAAAGNSSPTNDFGNAQSIIEQFTDKHDAAEDATFFSSEIKEQLKATLTEMWNAELHLRTFKTQEALPFEYKALRLLKDLQQKSRAYVAKTGVKTTPLKEEKRLTGDLSKIIEPQKKIDRNSLPDADEASRASIAILEELKSNSFISAPSFIVLQQSAQHLGKAATTSPSQYLVFYQSIKKVLEALNEKTIPANQDITSAQQGLQKIMAPSMLSLKTSASNDEATLSQQYFKNLKSKKD